MDPQDFLAVVLPTPGHGVYCTCELNNNEHQFVREIPALFPHVERWHKAGKDVYMALASFDEAVLEIRVNKDRRTAVNARFVKSLWLDLDGYADTSDALLALVKLMSASGLDEFGKPWVVASGGGLHVYWPFAKEVDAVTWTPVSRNMVRLCKQLGIKIDTSVMGDAARVLRVPDTTNFKKTKTGEWKYGEPKPVRLMQEGDIFDFSVVAAQIASKLTSEAPVFPASSNVIQLAGARPAASAASIPLFENTATLFKNIIDRTVAGKGCSQIADYIENAKDDGMEPKWRAILTLTKHCDDGAKWSARMSDLHPYDHDRMHRKLAEAKGPWLCKTFDEKFPGICDGCPARAGNPKLTTPMMLGREVMTTIEAAEYEVPVEEPVAEVEEEVVSIQRPEAPWGFSYGERGGAVFCKIKAKKPKGTEEEDDEEQLNVMLLPFEMFAVDVLHSRDAHMVKFIAMRKEGPKAILIPVADITSKDKTLAALGKANVIAVRAALGKNLHEYVWAASNALHAQRAKHVPDRYGWQDDGTYVFASRIFKKGHAPEKVDLPELQNIVQSTQPTGTLENWREYLKMMVRRGMHKQLAVFLLGTCAPLMRYTGLYGITVHCCSTESGTGKTLTLNAAASVWGHPVHYRVGQATSPVAAQQHLGMLHCHPLIMDEITQRSRTDLKWFSGSLFDMTDGKGKERMEAGANRSRVNTTLWASTWLMTSNTHMVDALLTNNKNAAEGEIRRLLEFVMDEPLAPVMPGDADIIRSLSENYGVAGCVLVQYMVDHEDKLRSLVKRCIERVEKDFKATPDERFWMAAIGCALAMGILLSGKHADIIDLPLDRMLVEYKECVEYMRGAITSNQRTATALLDEYIQENASKMLVVRKVGSGRPLLELNGLTGDAINKSRNIGPIAGRVEHDFVPGHTDLFIEKRAIQHFVSHSMGWKQFLQKLGEDTVANKLVEIKLNKTMSKDTDAPTYRVDALRVLRPKSDHGNEADGTSPAVAAA
jgi:hypothetical protein